MPNSKAAISGELGESFIKNKFGVVEDDTYEIKSTSRRNNQVILKTIQLINSCFKFYIIVRYNRKMRPLKRGPRKGQYIPDETIHAAYKRKLDVFITRGFNLLNLIVDQKRLLMATQFDKDASWAFYWAVRVESVREQLEVVSDDDEATIYGDPKDLPPFLLPEDKIPF